MSAWVLMTYPEWLESRVGLLKIAAHERRIDGKPRGTAASRRAKLKYEASAKGQAKRAAYTRSAARLESKANYRNTTWGFITTMKWNAKAAVVAGRARVEMLDAELAAMGVKVAS